MFFYAIERDINHDVGVASLSARRCAQVEQIILKRTRDELVRKGDYILAVRSRHSCRLARCAGRAFYIARTNTCRRGISSYSGIPGHIEIRWPNDSDHGVAFCCDPLWRLIGSCCESPAESLYLCNNTRARRGMRAVVARATRCTCMYIANNLYRRASTRVYRVNRYETETLADSGSESFYGSLYFLSLCVCFISLRRSRIAAGNPSRYHSIKCYKAVHLVTILINNLRYEVKYQMCTW